jgi:hypothetical protein
MLIGQECHGPRFRLTRGQFGSTSIIIFSGCKIYVKSHMASMVNVGWEGPASCALGIWVCTKICDLQKTLGCSSWAFSMLSSKQWDIMVN